MAFDLPLYVADKSDKIDDPTLQLSLSTLTFTPTLREAQPFYGPQLHPQNQTSTSSLDGTADHLP
jgi:hypothetical protein